MCFFFFSFFLFFLLFLPLLSRPPFLGLDLLSGVGFRLVGAFVGVGPGVRSSVGVGVGRSEGASSGESEGADVGWLVGKFDPEGLSLGFVGRFVLYQTMQWHVLHWIHKRMCKSPHAYSPAKMALLMQ